jgi:hypothetical protein
MGNRLLIQLSKGWRRRVLLAFAAVFGACTFGFGPGVAAAQDRPVADVAVVSLSANVRHAQVGEEVIFTAVAANNGPDAADFALVADPSLFFPNQFEPSGFEILGAVDCQDVSPDGSSCEYQGWPPGATVTMIFHAAVKPTTNKVASMTSCVYSLDTLIIDPNPANDCLTKSLRIVGKRDG